MSEKKMSLLKLLFVSPALLFLLAGCQNGPIRTFQGYAEGEYVNISSSQSGRLEKLFVRRGTKVTDGSPLFSLECDNDLLLQKQVRSELEGAEAILKDYQKGARPQELGVIEAQLSQALANAENAQKQLSRNTHLLPSGAISQAEYDDSLTLARTTASSVQELQKTLSVAKLSKRPDQIAAQEAKVKQLRSAFREAQWRIDEKRLKAKGDALVFDTLYTEGEWVPSGGTVVRLLPPENIKIRFFVPQSVAEKVMIGDEITLTSHPKKGVIIARVSYISPEAEYTPPVIYSNETKEKLVFMIEAYPDRDDAPLLHPGQPVEITLGKL